MNAKSKIVFGFVVGIVTAAMSIGGEILQWFNCISAWLIGTCAFTLLLSLFAGKRRTHSVAVAALTTYLFVIAYTIFHDVVRNRWDGSDSVPMFFDTFFILVCLPTVFSFLFTKLIDFTRQYLHSKVPAWL